MRHALATADRRARQTIASFSYIALKGRTDLSHPEVEFLIFEDCKSYFDLSLILLVFIWSGSTNNQCSSPDDFATVHKHEQRVDRDGRFRTVYFARQVRSSSLSSDSSSIIEIQIGQSRARPLVKAHSVKTRAFYGNTSMDSEVGFLLAGQALVRLTLMIRPFRKLIGALA